MRRMFRLVLLSFFHVPLHLVCRFLRMLPDEKYSLEHQRKLQSRFTWLRGQADGNAGLLQFKLCSYRRATLELHVAITQLGSQVGKYENVHFCSCSASDKTSDTPLPHLLLQYRALPQEEEEEDDTCPPPSSFAFLCAAFFALFSSTSFLCFSLLPLRCALSSAHYPSQWLSFFLMYLVACLFFLWALYPPSEPPKLQDAMLMDLFGSKNHLPW